MQDGELKFDASRHGPKGLRVGAGLHFPILAEGLDLALHYGWFAEPSSVGDSLAELRDGQALFTAEVLKLVGPAPGRVLDVGTGRGETARALAAAGADVVTLSPDPNQGQWLARAPHPKVVFEALRFEDFAANARAPFDVVVFSESSNYVALDNVLAHSAALTKADGALVVAAPFLRGESSATYRDMHRSSELRARLRHSPWRIDQEHDFTANVAPTLRIGQRLVERRVVPSARAIDAYISRQGPLPLRLLGWLFQVYRRRALSLLERDLPALLDERTFHRDVAFLFLRLVKETP